VKSAHWQFQATVLDPLPPPGAQLWRQTLDSLLAASELPWEDSDKKGRPRRRDYRELLLDLRLLAPQTESWNPTVAGEAVLIALKTAITPQGLALKPEQVCWWLGQQLGRPLRADHPRRLSLSLDDRVLSCL